MVRAAGNAPACSCSRSKRLTFRLRSEEDSPAHRTRHPAITSTVRGLCRHTRFNWGQGNGRASGYCALYSGLEDRRVSLNTYARENWSPVMELHHSARFCSPLLGLRGQGDILEGAGGWSPIRPRCLLLGVLEPMRPPI